TVSAYAATSATKPLTETTITRREVGPHDVAFDIHFAGICHSDIHTVKGEWGAPTYPLVPGHEIAGIVTAVGPEVTKFKVGERVGVGCFVDSCRECAQCRAGEEHYCTNPGMIGTYNSVGRDGEPTQGGYSGAIVVDENYVLHIPDSLPMDAAAPLLCAGITLYSPLRHWNAGPGTSVGLLKLDGTLVELGMPERPMSVAAPALVFGRRSLAGSLIGGIAETQEMLNFCAEHDVRPEIEVIAPDYINEAYRRVLASDVRYRFVIDTATLRR
ncbi:MAG TPA: NAD(P)-dependent alcohol dehydrogenase, partial [Mycobacterium sp.]